MQLVVLGAELVAPRIPGANRLARHVVQHPALAGIHAHRMNLAAEHVVVVVHHDAVFGIDDFSLVAFDVEYDAGRVALLDRFNRAIALCTFKLVVRDGEESAAKRIHVGDRRSVGMETRFCARPPVLVIPARPRSVPRARWADNRLPAVD